MVINCNNEVCSPSNNNVSRAFWKKKGRSLQKDVTLRVIYSYLFHVLSSIDSAWVAQMFNYTKHSSVKKMVNSNKNKYAKKINRNKL